MHSQWLNQNKMVVQMQEEIDSLKKENAALKEELAAYKKSTRRLQLPAKLPEVALCTCKNTKV